MSTSSSPENSEENLVGQGRGEEDEGIEACQLLLYSL
jgi:hypothetical protein